jgi:hypothetical protein
MTRVGTRAMRLMPLLMLALVATGWQTTAVSATTCSGKCALGMLSSGTSSSLAFTLTNEASRQTLGSANLIAPSGVAIGQAGAVTANGFVNTAATAQVTIDTFAHIDTLALRNLSIPPGDSVTVQLASCRTPSSSPWTLFAKQANNFNGSPGNNFVTDPASGLVAPAGGCVLNFASGREPTNAVVQQDVTSAGFHPNGPPLEVEASDGQGTPIPGVSVTMNLVSPGGVSAVLGGTVTATTGPGGLASWPNLTLDHPGYFQLTASATGFTPATSRNFLVAQTAQVCGTGACSTPPLSTKSTTATITAINMPAAGDILSAGLGGYTYSCQAAAQGGYASVTDPVGFDVWQSNGSDFDPTASSQVTLDISKQTVQISPNNGAAFYQICYASNVGFAPRATSTLGVTTIPGSTTPFYFGLLPDCGGSAPAPCVQSRHKGSGGDVIISFLSAPGDLWGKS